MSFDEPFDRTGTHSVKWDLTEKLFGSDDVLPLWVADMDFRSPEPVLQALRKRVEHGTFGYTFRPDSYDQSIVQWVNKRHGWAIEGDWIHYIPGVIPGLCYAVQAFSEPGDKVVIQPPVYPPFSQSIKANRREVGNNELILDEGGYRMDFDDLEAQLKEDQTRLFVLCSPHNPVGRVWTYEELKRVVDLCLEYDVLLVSDDIHWDITYDGAEHIPVSTLGSDIQEQTIILSSPGKTFNIQGLLSGYAIIPNKELSEKFHQAKERNWVHLENTLSIEACEAAYREGEDWLDDLLDHLLHNRNYMMDYFENRIPEIRVIPPQGTYIAWLDCRNLGLSGKELKSFFTQEAKVGLNDGRTFGSGGIGFQRINFACPRKTLEEGLERIEKAVKAKDP